jgi:hypothetical protein
MTFINRIFVNKLYISPVLLELNKNMKLIGKVKNQYYFFFSLNSQMLKRKYVYVDIATNC